MALSNDDDYYYYYYYYYYYSKITRSFRFTSCFPRHSSPHFISLRLAVITQ